MQQTIYQTPKKLLPSKQNGNKWGEKNYTKNITILTAVGNQGDNSLKTVAFFKISHVISSHHLFIINCTSANQSVGISMTFHASYIFFLNFKANWLPAKSV